MTRTPTTATTPADTSALDTLFGALADRFGLSLGFHACDQETYLAMVARYAETYCLAFDAGDALTWAAQRGARSGRVAWHYTVDVAGRAGRTL